MSVPSKYITADVHGNRFVVVKGKKVNVGKAPSREPKLSWSPGSGTKKYRVELVWPNGKKRTVQFGDRRYQQYKDRTPLHLFRDKNHLDTKRRELYRKRQLGKGTPSKYSAGYFALKYLWT